MDESVGATLCSDVEHETDTPSTTKIHNLHEQDIVVDDDKEIETEKVEEDSEEQVHEECDVEQDEEDQEAFADDIVDAEEEELPELVDLPFMKKGFKWADLMPKSFYHRKHAKKPDQVAPDLVDSGTCISIKHLRNRCKYTVTDHTKKTELDKASDFITDLLKKIRINIQVIICKFFMAIATYLDFGVNEKSGIVENYDDFVDAVENVTSVDDSKKVLIIIYLVFDFMKHWQKEVAAIVCKRCNIVVVDKEKKETKARYDFVYKNVTYVTNQQRKNVNIYSGAAVGLRYTIMRWGIHLKKAKNKYDSRKQKCIYKWMIMEDKSEIQPVTHQRTRKNMSCLKNDWYPIHDDNPNIMKEAGMFSIKKKELKRQAQEDTCDLQEDSLDGKPKAVTKIKDNIVLKKITYGPKSPNILKNALDKNNNVPEEVHVEVCNSNAAADGSSILLSPGQITLGNDSYLEGYSHASNYSVIKQTEPSGQYFDKNVGRFYNNVSELINKIDNDNMDQETDEVTIKWEIERDWNAKYFRRSFIILNKKIRNFKIIEICNLRKQYGFEGELLVRWNNGQRDWSPVSQVYVDNQVLVNEFLPKMKQTMITVEFGLYNKQQEEEEEKRLQEEREKQEIKEQQEMNDVRKIQTTRNKLPMKRKLDKEYGTTNKKQKQEKPKQLGTRNSKRILQNSSPNKINVNKPNPSKAIAPNKRQKNIISPNPKPNNEPNPNQVTTRKHTNEPNPDLITEPIPKKSNKLNPYEVYKQKQNDIEKAAKANLCTTPNPKDDTPNPKPESSPNPDNLLSPTDYTTTLVSTSPNPEADKPNPDHNSIPNPNQHSKYLDQNNSTIPNPEAEKPNPIQNSKPNNPESAITSIPNVEILSPNLNVNSQKRAAVNRTTSYLNSATCRLELVTKVTNLEDAEFQRTKYDISGFLIAKIVQKFIIKLETNRHPDYLYIESRAFREQLIENIFVKRNDPIYKDKTKIQVAVHEAYLLNKWHEAKLLEGEVVHDAVNDVPSLANVTEPNPNDKKVKENKSNKVEKNRSNKTDPNPSQPNPASLKKVTEPNPIEKKVKENKSNKVEKNKSNKTHPNPSQPNPEVNNMEANNMTEQNPIQPNWIFFVHQPNPAIIIEPNPKVTTASKNKSNRSNKTDPNPSQPNPASLAKVTEPNPIDKKVKENKSNKVEKNKSNKTHPNPSQPNPEVNNVEANNMTEQNPIQPNWIFFVHQPNPAIIIEPNPKITRASKNKRNDNNMTEQNPSQPNPEVNNVVAVSEKPSPEVVTEPNPKVLSAKKLPNAEGVTDRVGDEPSPAITSEPNPKVTKVEKNKSNNNMTEQNQSQPNPEVKDVEAVSEKPSPEVVTKPNPKVIPSKKLSVKKKIKSTFKCCKKYDHNDLSKLDEESNSGYCKPNFYFYEVKCKGEGCKLKFVCDNNKLENTFKPTKKFPMYRCTNTSAKCTYALCYFCYTEKQNPSSD